MPDGSVTTVVMTAAAMIEKFIQLRDKIDEIKKKQAEQLKPYQEVMQKLEGMLMLELERAGVDNMKCDAGTVFKSTSTSVTVQHWSETLKYIQETEAWDLLEARVSKTAAKAIIEESGHPIPGVNVNEAIVLRVRRS
jgi:hypothetical protein